MEHFEKSLEIVTEDSIKNENGVSTEVKSFFRSEAGKLSNCLYELSLLSNIETSVWSLR